MIVIGYLHFITAPAEYEVARYMGVLFLLNFLGALVSGVGIFRGNFWWGWALGVFIAAGSIIASVPIVIIFLSLQRYIINGLTAGSVKG